MCSLQRKLFHTSSLNGYSILMNMHINNTAKISSRNSPVVPTRENKMYSVGMWHFQAAQGARSGAISNIFLAISSVRKVFAGAVYMNVRMLPMMTSIDMHIISMNKCENFWRSHINFNQPIHTSPQSDCNTYYIYM